MKARDIVIVFARMALLFDMKIAKGLLVLNVFGTIAWTMISFLTRNPLWLIPGAFSFSGAFALALPLWRDRKR